MFVQYFFQSSGHLILYEKLPKILSPTRNDERDNSHKTNASASSKKLDRRYIVRNFERGNIDCYINEDPTDYFFAKHIDETKGRGLLGSSVIECGKLIAFYRGEEKTEKSLTNEAGKTTPNTFFGTSIGESILTAKSEGNARLINDCCVERPN